MYLVVFGLEALSDNVVGEAVLVAALGDGRSLRVGWRRDGAGGRDAGDGDGEGDEELHFEG